MIRASSRNTGLYGNWHVAQRNAFVAMGRVRPCAWTALMKKRSRRDAGCAFPAARERPGVMRDGTQPEIGLLIAMMK
jgi:hypothetical protein